MPLFRWGHKESVRRHEGRPIRVLTFTWNVGNKMPNAEEVAQWLPKGGDGFDLVVVGTQENSFKEKKSKSKAVITEDEDEEDDDDVVVELERRETARRTAYEDARAEEDSARGGKGHARDAAAAAELDTHGGDEHGQKTKRGKGRQHTIWETMVAAHLGAEYVVVAHVVLWEMRLTVYALAQHRAHRTGAITNVQKARSATGIAGVLGNKGGERTRRPPPQPPPAPARDWSSVHCPGAVGCAGWSARQPTPAPASHTPALSPNPTPRPHALSMCD